LIWKLAVEALHEGCNPVR